MRIHAKAEMRARQRIPGGSLLVIKDGQTCQLRRYGFAANVEHQGADQTRDDFSVEARSWQASYTRSRGDVGGAKPGSVNLFGIRLTGTLPMRRTPAEEHHRPAPTDTRLPDMAIIHWRRFHKREIRPAELVKRATGTSSRNSSPAKSGVAAT